jgi:hypothetical protein
VAGAELENTDESVKPTNRPVQACRPSHVGELENSAKIGSYRYNYAKFLPFISKSLRMLPRS